MPNAIPLSRDTIESRLIDLDNATKELDKLAAIPELTFHSDPHNLALASFYLQRSLEDILGSGTHLLARLLVPVTVEEYAHIIPELAKVGIVSTSFAERNAKLGSYRNRLVHHYLNITSQEIYSLIHEHRDDLIEYGRAIKKVLDTPDRYGFVV